jgi:hypothetical protein
MDRRGWPRVRVLWVIAGTGIVAYLALLGGTFLLDEQPEQMFGVAPTTPGSLQIYVEMVEVQPVRQSVRLRLGFTPDPALRGVRVASAGRDLRVLVDDGDTLQELAFRANEPMQPVEMNADLVEGSVFTYPFDTYRLRLRLQAFAGAPPAPGEALPLALTVWSDAGAFAARTTEMADGGNAIRLELRVRRRLVLAWYAVLAYAAMTALAVSALTLGTLAYLGRREAESTLVAAAAGITFTLLALRNTLPGAPPFGVLLDLLVFLWVEVAAVIGLSLAVVAWVRQGPPPRPPSR